MRVLGIFIKNLMINDKIVNLEFSMDFLMISSVLCGPQEVTIHDNDKPESLINTLGFS